MEIGIVQCPLATRPSPRSHFPMPDRTLYKGLIEENHPRRPYMQNYWARATHLGEGIDLMLEGAQGNGFKHPVCVEADPVYDDNLPENVMDRKHRTVFWQDVQHYFPPEPTLVLPYG